MRRAAIHRRVFVTNLLSDLVQQATQRSSRIDDGRVVRRLNWLVMAIVLAGTVRLNGLVQTVPYGQANSVKTAETSLSLFLVETEYPASMLFARFRDQVLVRLPTRAMKTYRGKPIVIVDPTDYAKRSRRGKKGRQMQYTTKVRLSKRKKGQPARTLLSPGYVDIWAGVLLSGRHVLPLSRKLCSSTHPKFLSQNLLEEAVIWQALTALAWHAILIADRGFRRKALLVKLLVRQVEFVIRMADNIHVLHCGTWRNVLETARGLPSLGQVTWKEGTPHAIPGQAVVFRAQLREAPEEDDPSQPNPEVNLIVIFPAIARYDPLILATTLPVDTLWHVRAASKLYERRWAIETTFENMKRQLHLDEFMVRNWTAIERLLWAGAMAYSLLVLLRLQTSEEGQRFLNEVLATLRHRAVLGKHLTVGKIREALALDHTDPPTEWSLAAPPVFT